MKANEIMIGDYVYNHRNWECSIVEIHKDSAVVITRHYGEEEFLLSDLRPIPLTPEILEKNGFHEGWDEDIKLMVCDTIIVETGNNYKLYKDGKMYLRRVLAPLYYVHQLQHALRICGIEKEIIL